MPLTMVWWCLTTLSRNVRVRARLEQRDQGAQRLADVADEPEVDGRPPAEVQRLVVDLDDRLPGRQEGVVREVRAEHEQQVAVGQRLGGAAPAEQAGHPDGRRVVGLEHVLAAVGVATTGACSVSESRSTSSRACARALAAVDRRSSWRFETSSTALVERGVGGPA